MQEKMEMILDELVEGQKKKLMAVASQIVPKITMDDLLQPNDYPELETNGVFRYEEGLLAGIESARMALRQFSDGE
ncbi:MAG: hypothetical protein KDK40_03135 [Chlamydiia bacterium]|nr:hypothetical protein [Chlamydiia bacterium]